MNRLDIEAMEERQLLSGTIAGLVFEDYNANGTYDTTSTIANASSGTIGVAVDHGVSGVTVTAYDAANVSRGTATSAADGTYSLAASGTGPYRVVFTTLPAGTSEGPTGPNSKSTVQIVPNGNSTNVSLGVSVPNDYSVDNPLIATNEYIYGDPISGSYSNSSTIVGFPYSSGSQYGATGDYAQPSTFSFTVPAKSVGATFGLVFNPATSTLYASSYTKRFSGYGPNAAGTGTTDGAIYAVNPTTGVVSTLADLNTIFGANTAGVDFRSLPSFTGYATDGGNTGWDSVGKTSLGGMAISPDGSTLYVMNLANRTLYSIPTTGPINSTTVHHVSIPFNAPGATGTAGGTQAGDLRPFAVTYYNGQLYVGIVNSAESTQNKADLRAYVYAVNPTTLAFGASPIFQTALNYTRGNAANFSGSGNPSANWNPWTPTFHTLGTNTTASYAQPMLSGLAFDSSGNLVLGLRDRNGDQTGFFTNANPANASQTYEGIASGDTLRAFITTPGVPSSGYTLENNGRGPSGQGTGAQNTNLGPGGAEFYSQQNYASSHSNVASGGVYAIPGFNDVITSSYDPGTTTVRTGGIRFLNNTTGATDKAFQIYNTGFNAPPQSTFGKAAGIGDVTALTSLAPIEIGDRVFQDLNDNGLQDPADPGIAGVTVHLYRGTALVGTAVTDASGNYLFNTSNVSGGLLPNTAYQIRFDNTADFATGGPLFGKVVTIPNADPAGLSGSKVVLSGSTPIINETTGGAGFNDHSLDAGFVSTGSVSGTVYNDANNNGVKGGGEVGIQGVSLTLTGTDDLGNAVSVTATTDANGNFTFAGLRPSNSAGYTITETIPTGYLGGKDAAGTLGGTAPTTSPVIQGVVVTPAAAGTGYNYGNLQPASLAGFVYFDASDDGVKQSTEQGIGGATVTLTGTNDRGVAVNLTTTTLGDGSYSFANLRPSNAAGYTLTETQPAGYLDGKDAIGTPGGTAGNDVFSAIVLAPGVSGANNNFGELIPASLAGRVYFDANNDGVKQTGEAGIPGVTITITGVNDLGVSVNLTATTASDGTYSFANLRPSNAAGYTITETQPAGYLDGKEKIGTQGGTIGTNSFTNIVLASGVSGLTNDFGELQPSSLAGFVYVDSSDDGVKQSTEAGIAGVTVTLTGTNDLGAAVNLTTTTAADGSYQFTNLRPSNAAGYAITETQPAGFLDGKDTIGTPGGTAGNDVLSAIVLASGVNGASNNFGELQAASLSGFVYVDANNDGRKQTAEAGIAGVSVTLTGSDDLGNALNLTTTTAADGSYTFAGLRPSGSAGYTVTYTPSPAYTVARNTVGTSGGTLNGQYSITQVGITSGAAATRYFFGETGATISGFAFVDANANGTDDPSEAGLPGVTVTLLNAANQVVGTVTSGADGSYSFANLPAGNYTVVETQPNGYGTSTPLSDPVSLTTSGLPGVNFGSTTSSLTGVGFTDVNGNGTYDPGTDMVGAGLTITLTGTDANGNAVNLMTTTGSDGTFTFTGLLASNGAGYTVTETVSPGESPGTATPGTAGGTAGLNNDTISNIVIGAGISATGYQYPQIGTVISGVVFVDDNNNGSRDTGEPGVGNVVITLTPTAGPSFTTATDANGSYSFAGFPAGTYTITETVPAGYGTTTTTTLANVNVPSGGVQNENFGLSASALSGTVYNDFNNDGLLNTGEPGIAGVTINLRDNLNALIATTTTDANGAYLFEDLPAGAYTIQEVQPTAYGEGQDTAGSSGGSTATIDVISNINLPVSTSSPGYNFGERGATITGEVYLDNNANNAIDPGEAGVSGVPIQLLDGTGVLVATTITAADGTFSFPNLPAGNYTTHEERPNGYGSSASTNAAVTLTTGGAAPVNYGLTTSSLSGHTFLDLDNDGTPDAGEPPIAGVTITLIGTDATGSSVIRTTTTDAAGNYIFAGLLGGTYSIAEAQPAAYRIGQASAGSSGGTVGTDLITGIGLGSAITATGYNFGSLGYPISGSVFVDANKDGSFNPGEAGLGNVPLTLTLLNQANQVIATTTTAPDGTYTFSNVVAGSYTIIETPPSGYGTSTPTSLPVSVTNAGLVNENFGVTTSSLSGYSFLDANADNAYEPGTDIPAAGLPITLTGTDVNGNAVNVTLIVAADGSFDFTGLLAGTYQVATTAYPGINQQPAIVGNSGGNATGLDNVQGINLTPGFDATGYLYPGTGVAVSGTVFNDTNRDGILDNNEAGVSGVTVTLSGLNINTNQLITLTTTTDASGNYVFPFAAAEPGTITISVPANYAADTPTSIAANVPATGLTGQNFGLNNGTISGNVYADSNDDGLKTPQDLNIANVVLLLTGTDSTGHAVSLSTITAADGSYTFNGLNPSNAAGYTVSILPPAGYLDGIESVGTAGGTLGVHNISNIVLGAGGLSTANNFAELVPASLAGIVFVDANNDGLKNTGEVGILGVTVTLTGVDDLGNPVNLTTTTRASGNYSFTNLRPSNAAGYAITETQPAGYLEGIDSVGSQGGTLAADAFTGIVLTPGIAGANNNFAELAPGTVSGSVFADSNDDRTQESGEPGIAGVVLNLTGFDDLGNAVNLTTTTAADGSYSFTGLRPSDANGYTVTEAAPAGYLPGLEPTTGATSNGIQTGVILTPGGTAGNVSFPELLPASLSGYVYEDLNNGGAKGVNEPGIAGVTLTLTGTDDLGNPVNITAITDANGFYSFTNLRPSLLDLRTGLVTSYTITETQPAGFLDGKDAIGTPGGTAGNDVFSRIVLVAGFNGVNNNFGELPAAGLSGFVYVDANDDGIKQVGETGIGGVTVTLTGVDDLGAAVSLNTTTAADGSYNFVNLRPSGAGGYTIAEAQPAGYLDGKDAIGTQAGTTSNDAFVVSYVAGSVGTDNNFGELLPGQISGLAYFDANGNGARDAGEAGIGGVNVILTGVDDLGNLVNLTTTTAADGSYAFAELRPGNVAGYSVTETPPANYINGASDAGSSGGVAGANTVTGIPIGSNVSSVENDFGSILQSSLAGHVYFDANKNGVRDAGDAGIAGVIVTLTGTDTGGHHVQTFQVTGADGSYSFTNLVPGTYTLTVSQPSSYLAGATTAGSSGGTAGGTTITSIPLGSSLAAVNYDFGEVGTTVSGTVYADNNGDGKQDNGEAGVGGATITLVSSNGTPVGTTTTAPDGSYSFSNVPLDTYTIVRSPLAGFANGTGSSMSVCTCDATGTVSVSGQDFPLLPNGVISGFVYVDSDNSGTHTAGDAGISGIVVTLTGTDLAGNAITRVAVTAADGSYSFTGLPAGTYTVKQGSVAGYSEAQITVGSAGGQVGTDVISGAVLGQNAAGTEYDFGHVTAPIVGPVAVTTLSGTVYLDSAKNGRFDPVDFGIAHIEIILTGVDAQGNPIRLTTATDANGHYSFTDLPAGTYQVTAIDPTRPFRPGVANPGSAGGVAGSNQISQISLTAGSNNTNYNLGERIQAGCHLATPALLMLLKYGPGSTTVPVSVLRRAGAFPASGPIAYYLPTLASLKATRPTTHAVARAAKAVVHAASAHPSGPAFRSKPMAKPARHR